MSGSITEVGGSTPPSVHDFAGLASVAAHLRDACGTSDRKLVEDGKMTLAAADDRLRIASALAADWRRVVDRAPRSEPTATQAEMLGMLNQALPAAITRRDRAWKAMVDNAAQYRRHKSAELWSLSDAIDFFSEDVRRDIEKFVQLWLLAESITCSLVAVLWWQQHTGIKSIH